jgi:hypothetical protein
LAREKGEKKMTYPSDYFRTPSRREQKRGVVSEVETNWGVYTIHEKDGRVWIEANGHGGAQRRMPQVSSVEEAKQALWRRTKPLPEDDIISF